MREKVGKPRNTVFFQWSVARESRKAGSLKRRVRSQLARWEMKNCTPLWREAHLQVKMYKNTSASDHFWKLRCRKKLHAVVAWSTFPSQNVTKHTILGRLLEVQMSKKCTPLWREAHFQVKMRKTHHSRTTFGGSEVYAVVARRYISKSKMYKTHHSRTTFGGSDVEKVHAVVARSTFRSQNAQNTPFSDHFWRFRCRFASLHYITLHYYTTLHYITLHSNTTLHYITLHYTPFHYTSLPLHYTPLQLQLHNYTPLHSTTLHYTTPHYITLHYTTFHDTSLD